jgi:hypothetical protein
MTVPWIIESRGEVVEDGVRGDFFLEWVSI